MLTDLRERHYHNPSERHDFQLRPQELLNAMAIPERHHIWDHIYPKEKLFVRDYTGMYRNLGAYSTRQCTQLSSNLLIHNSVWSKWQQNWFNSLIS